MATIKSYTDISQSKKLAEILPIESADMHLTNSSIKGEMYVDEFKPVLVPYLRAKDSLDAYSKIVNNMIAWEVIPCWSLAALLDVLPDEADIVKGKVDVGDYKYMCTVCIKEEVITAFGNNLVDTCVDIIIKLHKRKLL